MRGAKEKRANRAAGLLSDEAWRDKALRIFAALIFLIGAAAPFAHQARANEAAAATAAQLQTLLGVSAEELGAFICHYEDSGTSELPGDEDSELCKAHCALFLALQHHMPAFLPGGLVWSVRGWAAFAAPFAYRRTLKANCELAEQARPRAPPASFETAIV
jgi:hypothetical protein